MAEAVPERARIERKISDTEKRIGGMLDLYLDGMLDKAALYAKTEKLQQECESCRSLLKNIDIIPSVPRAALMSFLLASRDSLASGDAALQRRVLLTFVEDIVLYRDRVELSLRVSPLSHGAYAGGGETRPHNVPASSDGVYAGGGGPCLRYSPAVSRDDIYRLYRRPWGALSRSC